MSASGPLRAQARTTRAESTIVQLERQRRFSPSERQHFHRGAADLAPRVDHRGYRLRRLLLCADLAALCLAYVLVIAYSRELGGRESEWLANLPLLAAAIPGWIVIAHVHDLYHVASRSTEHGVAEEILPIVQMTTIWSWCLLLVTEATGLFNFTVAQLAVFWAVATVLLMLLRAALRSWARRRSWFIQNTVVVGTGPEVASVIKKIRRHPEWGLHIVACVDHAPTEHVRFVDGVPLISGEVDVLGLIEETSADRVILAFAASYAEGAEERFELVSKLSERNVNVTLIPHWFELLGARFELEELEGMPLLNVPPTRLSNSALLMKRALDVAVSASALLVLAPFVALCAAAIKINSPGPVFFRQRRIGKDGASFGLLKFRSMHIDADERKDEVASLSFHGGGNETGMFKIKDDPRITRVGAFLRRTSLDELPQLWNILRGDMSLVGPRPLIEAEAKQVEGRYRRRLHITPGLTGLWQVHGRSEIPFEQMVNLDYLYVTSWSLFGDIKILLKTVPAVAGSRGAY